MDCNNIKDILIQYSLGDIDDIEKTSVEDHLSSCESCSNYLKESRSLWNLMDTWDTIEPDAGFVSSFWDKAESDEPEIKPGFFKWVRDVKFNWALAGAMASIFLVSIITFGAFSTDTRNSLFMSADERDELVLIELDNALAKETSDVLSIYGPWDGDTDVDANGGFN